jgi:hypothetical protein
MKLPESVVLCDAIELAALVMQAHLSTQDLARQFFPGGQDIEEEAAIRDALALAMRRKEACGLGYPFLITERSIKAERIDGFSPYLFLLFGRALNFGGPKQMNKLLQRFRKHFEDLVCWSLRKAGFLAEVLSVPRTPRGLSARLPDALREMAERFGEPANLKATALMPHDNDLDVDVLGVPVRGSKLRGGWPLFLIQCATEPVDALQRKVDEGAATFGTVWEGGFFPSCGVRGGATPDDLLALHDNYWNRLSCAGWILDRTRIVYLASGEKVVPIPRAVVDLWDDLWAARTEIDWQTGWQQAG